MNRLYPALCAVVMLAGCSKPIPTSTAAHTRLSPLYASTDQGSAPKPSALDCLGVHRQNAPAGAPADDVQGVRPGTSAALARSILGCAKEGYTFWPAETLLNVPAIYKGPQPLTGVVAHAPNDRIEVVFVGMSGQEVAARLTRTLAFPTDAQPPFAQTRQSLIDKFGTPTTDTGSQASGSETLRWIYEPSGRPMSPQNPSFSTCQSDYGPGRGFSFSGSCGLTIVGIVSASQDGGATSLELGLMNQAAAYKALDQEKGAIAALNRPTGAAPRL